MDHDKGSLHDIEYDADNGFYRVRLKEGRSPSLVAIDAVARIADLDPMELEPVYDGHNLTILDRVAGWRDIETVEFSEVTVTIADHQVTIVPEGELHISPPD